MNNVSAAFDGIDWLPEEETEQYEIEAVFAKKILLEKMGPGSEFTGWVKLPENYDREEFGRIKEAAEKIRKDSDCLIVCGIGGSYLGAAAAIDFLKGSLHNAKVARGLEEGPEIWFAGNNMAPEYISSILEMVKDKDFSVNVISKSGTTMETGIAFRIFLKALIEKYGKEEAAKRLYVTTDKEKGALKKLADKEGWPTFVVPDDIGGRFSVLTAVGLLPIAAAGCDIDELMKGAEDAMAELTAANDIPNADDFENNANEPKDTINDFDDALEEDLLDDAQAYAAIRQQLYEWDKFIELFVSYDPDLKTFAEWLKQLFGESEGKDGFGLFPASVNYTTDLHSMGQLVQDGERNLFETVLDIEEQDETLLIPEFDEDFDGFKYLEGEPVSLLNSVAVEGTARAHMAGDVPQVFIQIADKSAYTLGQLFYFFEFACGLSAYMEGVNPFDQPGVETYKKNIKILLDALKNQN